MFRFTIKTILISLLIPCIPILSKWILNSNELRYISFYSTEVSDNHGIRKTIVYSETFTLYNKYHTKITVKDLTDGRSYIITSNGDFSYNWLFDEYQFYINHTYIEDEDGNPVHITTDKKADDILYNSSSVQVREVLLSYLLQEPSHIKSTQLKIINIDTKRSIMCYHRVDNHTIRCVRTMNNTIE